MINLKRLAKAVLIATAIMACVVGGSLTLLKVFYAMSMFFGEGAELAALVLIAWLCCAALAYRALGGTEPK